MNLVRIGRSLINLDLVTEMTTVSDDVFGKGVRVSFSGDEPVIFRDKDREQLLAYMDQQPSMESVLEEQERSRQSKTVDYSFDPFIDGIEGIYHVFNNLPDHHNLLLCFTSSESEYGFIRRTDGTILVEWTYTREAIDRIDAYRRKVEQEMSLIVVGSPDSLDPFLDSDELP